MNQFALFIIFTLFSSLAYSQPSKDKAKPCDTSCTTQKLGIAAVPVTAAFGYKKLMDEFGLAEREIYTGLSDQSMTKSEISKVLVKIKENRAFERSSIIIVNNSHIDTKHYSPEEFKLKLEEYSTNKKGVYRIAIKNLRLVKGGSLFSAIAATSMFLFMNDGIAGEAEPVYNDQEQAADFSSRKWVRPYIRDDSAAK